MAKSLLNLVVLEACLFFRNADGAATNPPGCAIDIATIINSAASVAQDLVYATETCNPMWWTPPFASGTRVGIPPPNLFTGGLPRNRRAGFPGSPNFGLLPNGGVTGPNQYVLNQDFCANNLLGFFADFTTVLATSVDAALKCGGADNTGCPNQVLLVIASIATASQDITAAAGDCQIGDRWSCAGDVFDSLSDWVVAAQNVQTGVQLCDTTIDAWNAPEPIPDNTTAPEPGAPEPEPNAGGKTPEPEPNAAKPEPNAPEPEPNSGLKAQFFPTSDTSLQGLERRLKNILAEQKEKLPKNSTNKTVSLFTKEEQEHFHVMYDNLLERMDAALAVAHHRMQFASLFRGKEKKEWPAQKGLKLKARESDAATTKESVPQEPTSDLTYI